MLIAVTNRTLCQDDFLMRIEAAASAKPSGILLREKDLSDAAYAALAAQCRTICATQGVPLIVNRILSTPNPSDWLQLPFPIFQQHRRETLPGKCIGVSVHALEEACTAQKLGADFLIAGHIFSTACKKGLPPRGLSFLQEICTACSIPVLGIGGISAERIPAVLQTGAAGACIMSEWMTQPNPQEIIQKFLQVL